MKKFLILIGLFVSLYSFSQDLTVTNPRKIVNGINYSNKGKFNIMNYGATEGGTVEDATAIQAAINAATDYIAVSEDGGGTVVIPSGIWYINKPDTLKSNISIEIDKNAQFRFPDAYEGAMWVNDTTELLVRCYVKGGRFYQTTNNFTFAKIQSSQSANYVMFLMFKDCYIERANIVFDFELFNTGWINANVFDNIIAWMPVEYLKQRESVNNAGFDANIFSNNQVQPENGTTTFAIDSLSGSYNLFSNFVMWDADAFSNGIVLTNEAAYNTIIGSLIPKNKFKNVTPTNYNLVISDGQILSGYEIFNSDNDTTLLGNDILNLTGGKIYSPDQIVIHGRSEVKDTIDKLVVSHSSDAGTSGTPAGDIAIKLKSYALYADDYAGANRAARIMSRNSAGSDYASWLYLQTHGTGSSESYVDALTLKPSGGLKFTLAGIPNYANNAAAISGGLVAGDIYRTNGDPDVLCIVH